MPILTLPGYSAGWRAPSYSCHDKICNRLTNQIKIINTRKDSALPQNFQHRSGRRLASPHSWRRPLSKLRRGTQVEKIIRKYVVCCGEVLVSDHASPPPVHRPNAHHARGLFQIARIIGAATLISKMIGLAREAALAAVFGVGPVVNAFNYASIVPGFFLTMLGGINGPFHTAMTSALSKRPKEEGQYLVASVSILAGLVCAGMSVVIFLQAGLLIDTLAPGLSVADVTDGLLTRQIAILQLKVMAPCALLAALIGLGFGSLSANGIYGVPSLSPALSSISILAAVSLHVVLSGHGISSTSQQLLAGGISVAVGSTVGAFLQWSVQEIVQHRAGLGVSRMSWANPFKDNGVYEVMAVMIPAALNSGMTQLATFTDLYFASFIPGAAAALGYANLLVMAPLGILSSPVQLSLLPLFARLTQLDESRSLRDCVQQGLLLSMALTLSMTAVMIPLACPIVRVAFERHAFGASESGLVSSLLICYISGATFYLVRDVLVQVFYALGDGRTPLYITMAAIAVNGVLDWLLVRCSGFGAPGLVVATMLVNFTSAGALLIVLTLRLGNFRMRWGRPVLMLLCCGTYSAVITRIVYDCSSLFISSMLSSWASNFLALGVASALGFTSFFAPLVIFKPPEVSWVLQLLQSKSGSRLSDNSKRQSPSCVGELQDL